MKEILERVSSYNLFNYLWPGALYATFVSWTTRFQLTQSDIVIALVVYYFLGLTISRIGSLLVEPVLRRSSFITFGDYATFVAVAKRDSKLDTLVEVSNTYRTLCSLFLCLMGTKIYEIIAVKIGVGDTIAAYIACGGLTVLFLFSYKKQAEYIRKRIAVANKSSHIEEGAQNAEEGQKLEMKQNSEVGQNA